MLYFSPLPRRKKGRPAHPWSKAAWAHEHLFLDVLEVEDSFAPKREMVKSRGFLLPILLIAWGCSHGSDGSHGWGHVGLGWKLEWKLSRSNFSCTFLKSTPCYFYETNAYKQHIHISMFDIYIYRLCLLDIRQWWALEAGWIGFPLLHFENLTFIKDIWSTNLHPWIMIHDPYRGFIVSNHIWWNGFFSWHL